MREEGRGAEKRETGEKTAASNSVRARTEKCSRWEALTGHQEYLPSPNVTLRRALRAPEVAQAEEPRVQLDAPCSQDTKAGRCCPGSTSLPHGSVPQPHPHQQCPVLTCPVLTLPQMGDGSAGTMRFTTHGHHIAASTPAGGCPLSPEDDFTGLSPCEEVAGEQKGSPGHRSHRGDSAGQRAATSEQSWHGSG